MIQAICFYVFAAITILSGFMVISARNPVHSVLFLILAFFNAAALFLLMGAEFLAMILVIVYVGAVAVLFLFVVMMLDIDFEELRKGATRYLPIGALIGVVLLAELLLIMLGLGVTPPEGAAVAAPAPSDVTNTQALGQILYTDYIYLFQAAGMILLVAMIGAIVLTHRTRKGVKKQNISRQVKRRREDAVEIRKVQPGQGI
ncbi:MAG: NADH-quinone oxidoreductase subunit J [Sphingomonadales bacterium]|nr:NADH-quinone oxidoreductase subunit J [Sphingomonadales bacterium]